MRAFFSRVLLLCCGMTTLATGALVLGRGLPASPLVQRWHLTDCAPPCWLGIVPGETPVDEAIEQLSDVLALPPAYPLTEFPLTMQGHFYALPLPGYPYAATTVAARIAPDDGNVVSISFPYAFGESSDTTMPRLGDVVATFGLPSCVDPWTPFHGWSLYYDTAAGVAQVLLLGDDTLTWNEPVYFLHFYEHGSQSGLETCRTNPASFYTWRGLDRDRYPQRP